MRTCIMRAAAVRSCSGGFQTAAISLLAFAGLSTAAQAAPLIPNGGFEEGAAGWSLVGNAGIRQSAPYTPAEGSRLVAFNSGNTAPNGGCSRSFPTVGGLRYRLDFSAGVLCYQNGGQRIGVTVTGSGTLLSESVDIAGQGGGRVQWVGNTFYFTADGTSATLVFRDLSMETNGIDLLLDAVSIEKSDFRPLVNGGLENNGRGWSASGNVRTIAAPVYQPTEGRSVASFNTGDTAPNGVMSQVVSTVPWRRYLLTFDAGILSYARSWQKMEIRISGSEAGPWQFSEPGSGNGKVEWRKVSISFIAHENLAEIEFRDTSDETRSVDLLLDNVRLLEVPPGFVLVYPATFMMGSPVDDFGHAFNETLHSVSFARHLLVKTTEVTWNEWNQARSQAQSRGYNDIAVGRNGYNGRPQGDHPVSEVSWWDALKWCNLKSEMDGLKPVYYSAPGFGAANVLRMGTPAVYADWSADGYRLPTESEWENFCRAGTKTAFFNGPAGPNTGSNVDSTLDLSGWYSENSGGNTQPVAMKIPSPWQIYDAHGNVWEWCWDRFADEYPLGPVTDPRGPAVGNDRIIRGGSFHMLPYWCRSAQRAWHDPLSRYWYLGFRPVRAIVR